MDSNDSENGTMSVSADREILGVTEVGKTEFHWGERTYVMGILNVSPDSFSGDGKASVETAIEQGKRFEVEGADILDVGGESTRPDYKEIDVQEELRRVIPVIEKLVPQIGIPVSIDSYKYDVCLHALEAGATILNDQWGLKKDARLGKLAAKEKVPIILMSNQRDKGGYDSGSKRDIAYYKV